MNTVPDFPDLVPNKAGDTKEIHTIVKQLQEEIRRLQTPAEPSFREKFEDMVRINEQLRIELEKTQAELESSKTNESHARTNGKKSNQRKNSIQKNFERKTT